MTENMPLRESVNLEDVMREVKALREEVKAMRNYPIVIQPAGYCVEGENHCVCGGDLPRVREGCGNWRKAG